MREWNLTNLEAKANNRSSSRASRSHARSGARLPDKQVEESDQQRHERRKCEHLLQMVANRMGINLRLGSEHTD